jgi:ABC-type polar amino acid transport system ATPase subunit
MGIIIQFVNVEKWFTSLHVLKDVNLNIQEKEVVVICGPSGSGKSTLIRCINGLEPIQKGEIIVDGISVSGDKKGLKDLRARIGMVFQHFHLYPHKSVLDNITLAPRYVKGLPKKNAEEMAIALLEKVGIPEKRNAYPSELSGGQQQRVAIARSLAMSPKIMLFDEPTSALDPEMINEVHGTMISLAKEGMTMIVITHEMGFAKAVAKRIVFIDEGKIIETGNPVQFFESPKNERTRLFLDKILKH